METAAIRLPYCTPQHAGPREYPALIREAAEELSSCMSFIRSEPMFRLSVQVGMYVSDFLSNAGRLDRPKYFMESFHVCEQRIDDVCAACETAMAQRIPGWRQFVIRGMSLAGLMKRHLFRIYWDLYGEGFSKSDVVSAGRTVRSGPKSLKTIR